MSSTNGDAMALGMSERLKPIHDQVARMIADEILPLDEEFLAEVEKGDRWEVDYPPD